MGMKIPHPYKTVTMNWHWVKPQRFQDLLVTEALVNFLGSYKVHCYEALFPLGRWGN